MLELPRAIQGANVALPAGDLNQSDAIIRVETASAITRPEQLNELVVRVSDGRPIFLKDVVTIEDAHRLQWTRSALLPSPIPEPC